MKNIYATALVINGKGILIRGKQGYGKSLLTLELLDYFKEKSSLIADDRVDIVIENNVIFMSPPKNIAGLIELHGRGIISLPYQEKAQLNLIVDLVEKTTRMPEKGEFFATIEGMQYARCPIPKRKLTDSSHQILLIKQALAEL